MKPEENRSSGQTPSDKSYPKLEVVKDSNAIKINADTMVEATLFTGGMLDVRTGGQFHEKAYYLNPAYHWTLGVDNLGVTVLVPTKKQ